MNTEYFKMNKKSEYIQNTHEYFSTLGSDQQMSTRGLGTEIISSAQVERTYQIDQIVKPEVQVSSLCCATYLVKFELYGQMKGEKHFFHEMFEFNV